MSKVIVFLLEFLLMTVILPLMNFFNKLHQIKYRFKLHKIRIHYDENEEEENVEEENVEDKDKNDIKLNDFTFIDDKLD